MNEQWRVRDVGMRHVAGGLMRMYVEKSINMSRGVRNIWASHEESVTYE